nr:8680_t:CDS:10 [Entrophospora candida]
MVQHVLQTRETEKTFLSNTKYIKCLEKRKLKRVIHDIPRNLKELGYQINEKGQFLTLKGEIYNFEVKERAYNEALYDVIIGNLLLFRDGSMISYVKQAKEMGFPAIIINPNEVFWYKGKAVHTLPKTNVPFKIIMGSETPESHTNYVFENFVIYGGHCAVDVMQNSFELLKNRVKGIEFTETTHSIDFNCRNWLMSSEPAGSEICDSRFGCISFSSGVENNEFVTYEVIDRVFEHVAKKLEQLENGATKSNDENEGDIEDGYLISEALKPIDLEIINESDLHAHNQAMKDVSKTYIWTYQLLGELKRGVHALSIKAKTPKGINREENIDKEKLMVRNYSLLALRKKTAARNFSTKF